METTGSRINGKGNDETFGADIGGAWIEYVELTMPDSQLVVSYTLSYRSHSYLSSIFLVESDRR